MLNVFGMACGESRNNAFKEFTLAFRISQDFSIHSTHFGQVLFFSFCWCGGLGKWKSFNLIPIEKNVLMWSVPKNRSYCAGFARRMIKAAVDMVHEDVPQFSIPVT